MSKAMTSNKSYIVRAYYDWISDNQLTPYIVVDVNVHGVLVPMTYVNDGQITLNISSSALGTIVMGRDVIELSARFSGKLEHITVPYGAVAAIYAKENGAGTSLAIEHPEHENERIAEIKPEVTLSLTTSTTKGNDAAATNNKTKKKGKASLKVIK